MWRHFAVHAAPLIALLAGCGRPADAVHVWAAVSLTESLTTAADGWEQSGARPVVLNFAASNVLARQIEAGANADLFISADVQQMDRLVARDLIARGDVVPLLSNQLVVVEPARRARRVRSAADLADPAITHIAIGDPQAVPAGVYARAWLERIHMWTPLASRLVPCASVRAALAAVEAEAAEAAIVYRTDAIGRARVRVAYEVPAGEGPDVVYPAAVLRASSRRAAAGELLAWLQGSQARAAFTAAGFTIPAQVSR